MQLQLIRAGYYGPPEPLARSSASVLLHAPARAARLGKGAGLAGVATPRRARRRAWRYKRRRVWRVSVARFETRTCPTVSRQRSVRLVPRPDPGVRGERRSGLFLLFGLSHGSRHVVMYGCLLVLLGLRAARIRLPLESTPRVGKISPRIAPGQLSGAPHFHRVTCSSVGMYTSSQCGL